MIDANRLDFGEVWETDRFEWAAPVQNYSDASVRVSTFNSSCGGCVAPSSTTPPIAPGGTGEVKFTIDLRNPCASAEPQAIRDAKILVFLGKDAAGSPLVPVELRGRVKSALIVPARHIDFGRFPATANPKPLVVPVRGLINLSDLTTAVDGHTVQAELKPTEPGKWELHVRVLASAGMGRHTATVRLIPTTTSGEQVPPIPLSVVFDVLHDIQPDTSLVPLGEGRVGEIVRGSLTLSSLSGRPFPLPTADGAAEVIRLTDPTSSPRSSYTFNLSRRVTTVGQHGFPLVVRGCDADGRPFEVRVEVHFYGLEP